jgi:hypothetical protein
VFTVFASPTHILAEEIDMPTIRDPVGNGALALRRQQTRALRRWELNVPGQREKLDPIMGLLEYAQGDSEIWFDGAGMIEVVEPILVAVGDGATTDFKLPHRYVYVSSVVAFLNSANFTAWAPLGDGVLMDGFRCDTAPAEGAQITMKYRRKAKCILRTEERVTRERVFRNMDNEAQTAQRLRYVIEEVAI